MTIYADHEIPQVVGRDRRARRVFADVLPQIAGSLPVCIDFPAHKIFPRLPLPNQRELIAANERFCRERTRIVVRRHHKSVRAGAHDCEQIAFVQFGHLPVERKEIARLTHRSDNVDLFAWRLRVRLSLQGRGLG